MRTDLGIQYFNYVNVNDPNGPSPNRLDPDYKAQHDTEVIAGLERELAANFAISAAYTLSPLDGSHGLGAPYRVHRRRLHDGHLLAQRIHRRRLHPEHRQGAGERRLPDAREPARLPPRLPRVRGLADQAAVQPLDGPRRLHLQRPAGVHRRAGRDRQPVAAPTRRSSGTTRCSRVRRWKEASTRRARAARARATPSSTRSGSSSPMRSSSSPRGSSSPARSSAGRAIRGRSCSVVGLGLEGLVRLLATADVDTERLPSVYNLDLRLGEELQDGSDLAPADRRPVQRVQLQHRAEPLTAGELGALRQGDGHRAPSTVSTRSSTRAFSAWGCGSSFDATTPGGLVASPRGRLLLALLDWPNVVKTGKNTSSKTAQTSHLDRPRRSNSRRRHLLVHSTERDRASSS